MAKLRQFDAYSHEGFLVFFEKKKSIAIMHISFAINIKKRAQIFTFRLNCEVGPLPWSPHILQDEQLAENV